jgi:formylglycine-generating enzyme required for sulfatase activity
MTTQTKQVESRPDTQAPPFPEMVRVPGGTFRMGSDDFYPEERPQHEAAVGPFWMDRYLVTNQDFARFVESTGYVTLAERPPRAEDYPGADPALLVPGSLVFQRTKGPVDLGDWRQWWRWTPGACWRKPKGAGTSIRDLQRHPVVHVAYEDVEAYAKWSGKQIPTEAEWEFAARGGLDGAAFTWGNEQEPNGRPLANTWQGEFPWRNTLRDRYYGTSPVGTYPANGYGLFDMAGNVWEWTSDWYAVRHHQSVPVASCCTPGASRAGAGEEASYDTCQPEIRIPRKVLKGGSHLCAPNYCLRFRPAARSPQMIDTGMSHIGFRCISRAG